jgi:hypothetical protein
MKNTNKLADQLLAVLGRMIDIVKDLNAVTTSMLDALNEAAAGDGCDLDYRTTILEWARRLRDISSDVSGAMDDIVRTIEEVCGYG